MSADESFHTRFNCTPLDCMPGTLDQWPVRCDVFLSPDVSEQSTLFNVPSLVLLANR